MSLAADADHMCDRHPCVRTPIHYSGGAEAGKCERAVQGKAADCSDPAKALQGASPILPPERHPKRKCVSEFLGKAFGSQQDLGYDEEAVRSGKGKAAESVSTQSAASVCTSVLFYGKGYCPSGGYTGAFQHQYDTDLYAGKL